MKLSLNTLFGIALMAIVLSVYAISISTPDAHATSPSATVIGTATTSTAVSVGASTRILSTTTNALGNGTSYTRTYATICNATANPVLLLLNNDIKANASTTGGYWIAGAAGYNACFEITDRNLYNGSIQASSTNQVTTFVNVTEYVQ